MANNKDPAFMFYPADFMLGTFFMTDEEVGQYIRLLCLQHQQGRLTEQELLAISKSEKVKSKFKRDSDGKYFNNRLEDEITKRLEYKEKQRINGAMGGRSKAKAMLEHRQSTAIAPLKQPSSTRVENENINVIKDVIEYLNDKLSTKYRYSADYIQRHIKARIAEGATFEDFRTVIDKKYDEWIGTEFAKFLRPETLFGVKFQQYLNQIPSVPSKAKQNPRYGDFDPDEAFKIALERSKYDKPL